MMNFQAETLYLAIHLLNQSLCKIKVTTANLQLLGMVCLFLAAKKEECLLPEVHLCSPFKALIKGGVFLFVFVFVLFFYLVLCLYVQTYKLFCYKSLQVVPVAEPQLCSGCNMMHSGN